jgi:hypothetical protein
MARQREVRSPARSQFGRCASVAILALWLLLGAMPAAAQGWGIGDRIGNSIDGPRTTLHEIYGRVPLPQLSFLADYGLTLDLEGSAGLMEARTDSGLVANIGPVFLLQRPGIPLLLEAGVRPGYLERHQFGRRNLGGPFTFSSHIGLQLTPFRPLALGYRLQHFSNAFIYPRNPGINLHMLQLQLHF